MADCPKCPPAGAPLWLATFADLMSLLMCFFVLLLSFATMDAKKFKATAESLENAFGVQRDIEAAEIPMGTSIIAQHFSPASTNPTLLEEVKQSTSQSSTSLDVSLEEKEKIKQEIMEQALDNTQAEAKKIEERLKDDINKGLVSVETQGLKIIIRINEKGSFGSGSAILKSGFEPVMNRITESVISAKGKVLVAGHTDDIPISTDWYRSNWELSAGRSVSVAEFMLKNKKLDPKRIIIEGHADTQPLVPNTSSANRAKNRRVEVILVQDDPTLEFDKTQTHAQE
ncbi:MotB family protein [methanotrophic endosymbiont of Bathymodiolus puteoserpentis (Logatchev)]|jgi:chemotaxis protein MotB|uniref:MotB family protein n=1 Tax=methanotrophic endosymbiont of Bathymodiolus puteoserpentis (Logatchev) TaxID=343235 RepID=UPI0013CD98BB|nr:MotB family protein [methanotrophic endosymbiont of Bathymodiolus puteoserpentis (Logatchev)]SHE23449.1 Flagellar motor rotation protein MotB [methanotrophic endosymbiont of Bathymodiolus puteoserpentis (Logatchev)]